MECWDDESHRPIESCALCGHLFEDGSGHICPEYREEEYLEDFTPVEGVIYGAVAGIVVWVCLGLLSFFIRWRMTHAG